jgi:uncharacterized protein (DUF433 family)
LISGSWVRDDGVRGPIERITVEADKCGGRRCIRGLRVRMTDVLGMLAAGVPDDEILRDFPCVEPRRYQGRLGVRGTSR